MNATTFRPFGTRAGRDRARTSDAKARKSPRSKAKAGSKTNTLKKAAPVSYHLIWIRKYRKQLLKVYIFWDNFHKFVSVLSKFFCTTYLS